MVDEKKDDTGALSEFTNFAALKLRDAGLAVPEDKLRAVMPYGFAAGAGLLSMLLIQPLTALGKAITKTVKFVLTLGGLIDFGQGKVIDRIGEYMGYAIGAAFSFLTFEAFKTTPVTKKEEENRKELQKTKDDEKAAKELAAENETLKNGNPAEKAIIYTKRGYNAAAGIDQKYVTPHLPDKANALGMPGHILEAAGATIAGLTAKNWYQGLTPSGTRAMKKMVLAGENSSGDVTWWQKRRLSKLTGETRTELMGNEGTLTKLHDASMKESGRPFTKGEMGAFLDYLESGLGKKLKVQGLWERIRHPLKSVKSARGNFQSDATTRGLDAHINGGHEMIADSAGVRKYLNDYLDWAEGAKQGNAASGAEDKAAAEYLRDHPKARAAVELEYINRRNSGAAMNEGTLRDIVFDRNPKFKAPAPAESITMNLAPGEQVLGRMSSKGGNTLPAYEPAGPVPAQAMRGGGAEPFTHLDPKTQLPIETPPAIGKRGNLFAAAAEGAAGRMGSSLLNNSMMAIPAVGQLLTNDQLTEFQKALYVGQLGINTASLGAEGYGALTNGMQAGSKLSVGVPALTGFAGITQTVASVGAFKDAWDRGDGLGMGMSGAGTVSGGLFTASSTLSANEALAAALAARGAQLGGRLGAVAAWSEGAGMATKLATKASWVATPLAVAATGLQGYAVYQESKAIAAETDAVNKFRVASHMPQVSPLFRDGNLPTRPQPEEYGNLRVLSTDISPLLNDGINLAEFKEKPDIMQNITLTYAQRYDENIKKRDDIADSLHKFAGISSSGGQMLNATYRLATGRDVEKKTENAVEEADKRVMLSLQAKGAHEEMSGGAMADASNPGLMRTARGYSERMNTYLAAVKPLEKDFPDQVALLEHWTDVNVARDKAASRVIGQLVRDNPATDINTLIKQNEKHIKEAQDIAAKPIAKKTMETEYARINALDENGQKKYFDKNAAFLAKAQLEGRDDLRWSGFSSNPVEYVEKMNRFAPTAMEGDARQAVALNAAAIQQTNLMKEELLRTMSENSKNNLPNPELKNADGSPRLDKDGKPVTFLQEQQKLAASIKAKTEELDAMRKDAQDPDQKARIAIYEAGLSFDQRRFATNEITLLINVAAHHADPAANVSPSVKLPAKTNSQLTKGNLAKPPGSSATPG